MRRCGPNFIKNNGLAPFSKHGTYGRRAAAHTGSMLNAGIARVYMKKPRFQRGANIKGLPNQ